VIKLSEKDFDIEFKWKDNLQENGNSLDLISMVILRPVDDSTLFSQPGKIMIN